MSNRVWVEQDMAGNPLRILRDLSEVFRYSSRLFGQWNRTDAVKSIRNQIFHRSHGYCEICGAIVLETSGHMHERVHRGRGGEISLENSVFICPKCHFREHADRNPRFSSSKPPEKGGFVTPRSIDDIEDGETVCRHSVRYFECIICMRRERTGDTDGTTL